MVFCVYTTFINLIIIIIIALATGITHKFGGIIALLRVAKWELQGQAEFVKGSSPMTVSDHTRPRAGVNLAETIPHTGFQALCLVTFDLWSNIPTYYH